MPRSLRPLAAVLHFLRRSPARAAALAGGVLVLTAAAYAATPAYQAHLDQLARQAAAARKRAGLQGHAACAQDPTPEMRFAKLVRAEAGSTFTLDAQGHFTKGTHFVFRSDHVHLVSAHLRKDGATLTGRVDPGAFPGTVALSALGPLCPVQVDFDAVKIEAATEWKLTLDNGWTCHLVAGGVGEDRHDCKATWSGGGRSLTLPCVLEEASGEGMFHVDLGGAQMAQARAMKQMQTMSDPEVVKAQGEIQEAAAAIGKCSDKPDQASQIACIQAASKRSEALQTRLEAATKAATARAMKDAFGCLSLDLRVTGDHQVSVDAGSCGYPDTHEGHGTVTVR